jgi:Cytochrome P450
MPFFVAALLRPEIQTMALRELDAVTMRERLPTFEDRPRLPFVDAICKEVKRWRPAVPLGELLLLACSSTQTYDDSQAYLTQPQVMMSMRVTLSPRVCILSVQICFAVD